MAQLPGVVDFLLQQVVRRELDAPGVALLTLGREIDSHALRQWMMTLIDAISGEVQLRRGRGWRIRSLARFDQQVTTKFHLDGAPAESYLLIGYEPSTVESTLAVADYSRAAFDQGLTPQAYLTTYNPMFPIHEARLQPYVRPIVGFDGRQAQVVLINNSSLPCDPARGHSLGVLHQATVPSPDPQARRVLNSAVLVPEGIDDAPSVGVEGIRWFVETDEVARRIGVE